MIFENHEKCMKNHFQHVAKKAQQAIFQLKTYLKRALGSEMPYDLVLKLFDLQIRPIGTHTNFLYLKYFRS